MTGNWNFRLIRAIILPLLLLLPLSAPKAQEIVIGDSIACGVKDAGQLYGVCRVGASPALVYFMLTLYPAEHLNGASVILSCGLSNNPQEIEYCRRDLAYLTSKGAKVIMLGVGDVMPDSVILTRQLRFLADLYDTGLIYGWHDIHPRDYNRVLAVIRSEECRLRRICSI